MGLLLGPVLADIFMVELENNIVPLLQENFSLLKQYVDEPTYFVKIGIINYIRKKLNNVDPNIKFSYEVERDCKLPFLDVLLIKNRSNIIPTLYHKATTNDIYLNLASFAPTTWKKSTVKTLGDCAYFICSSTAFKKKKIDHLKKVFHKKMVNLNGLLIKF